MLGRFPRKIARDRRMRHEKHIHMQALVWYHFQLNQYRLRMHARLDKSSTGTAVPISGPQHHLLVMGQAYFEIGREVASFQDRRHKRPVGEQC